jgi:hypothetical protein
MLVVLLVVIPPVQYNARLQYFHMSPDMQWLGKRKLRDSWKQLAYAVLCGAAVYYLADCERKRSNFCILRNLETKCNEDKMEIAVGVKAAKTRHMRIRKEFFSTTVRRRTVLVNTIDQQKIKIDFQQSI